MLIAALVIAVTASLGGDPNYYQPQTWQGPTETDLTDCATMAAELNATYKHLAEHGLARDWHTKEASCEVYVQAVDVDTPIQGSITRS
jgi:hypothetical protein